jgi:anaerobic ribonucleoside-triphosphate reductase activating protein
MWEKGRFMTTHYEKTTLSTQLNLANLVSSTHALGPGLRAVVWVQGCLLHCPGCLAPGWIPQVEAQLMTPEELSDRLLEDPNVTGITFSGGEPMLQAAGLAQTARLIRSRREVNIICFSGYRYEHLLHNPPSPGVDDLLEQLDVLVDGPYIEARNSGVGLRGSDNQRIIHLGGRLWHVDLENDPRRMEIRIGMKDLVIVGIPPHQTNPALARVEELVLD